MITWSPILHFYQPINSDAKTVQQVLYSCYLPVLDLFLNNPQAKATLHISGSLSLVLEQLRIGAFFEKVKELQQRDQIELIHSPVYHPIVPLIPQDAVARQINQSKDILEYFYRTSGQNVLFLPELAADSNTITQFGKDFEYIIVDRTSIDTDYVDNPFSEQQKVSSTETNLIVSNRMMTAIFRAYPNWINQNALIDYIYTHNSKELPVINANDVEVFGHHYEERIHILRELMHHPEITIQKLSDTAKNLTVHQTDTIIPSSWQTFPTEQAENNPYPMWLAPHNPLQQAYYALQHKAFTALSSIPKPQDDKGLIYSSAEKHFDIGTASCHSYWLSNKPWWHPELAEAGAQHLIKTIRTLPLDNDTKVEAEILYADLIKSIWQYNWSEEVKKNYSQHKQRLKEVRESLPDLR